MQLNAMQLNECVRIDRAGRIALVITNNPPVNALGLKVRQGMVEAMRLLGEDREGTDAIVIACEGRTFFAGADITEFNAPRKAPTFKDMMDAIVASPVPTVAAIHGTALGGGFELALACHYRVMLDSAVVGLPEIHLGLMAGGGGTKRLPRLIGPEEALKFCLSGERIPAQKALALGIADQVVQGDIVAGGTAFAREIAGKPFVPVDAREDKIAPTRADPAAFEALAAKLTARLKGQDGPAANVESIRDSFTLPLEEGLVKDADRNVELMAGSQSRALRHLFFAEREAKRIPGIAADAAPRPVGRVAIIGAGTMGGGIALAFASAGIAVRLIDTSDDAVAAGIERIKGVLAQSVKRGSLDQAKMDARLALVSGAADRGAVADCDLVVEAVFEDLALKQQIFSDVEALVKPGTILASNTSALDVDAIASVLSRPQDFIGLHFFAPANVMKLVEVVQGKASGGEAVLTGMEIARRVGKMPIWSGNCDGFIGNRMLAKRAAEAEWLLQNGALPQDVDGALTSMGFPMGPLAVNDMSGLDVGYSIRKRRGTPFLIADAVVESGRLGQKTGAGYYLYEAGSRTATPDPVIEQMILDYSRAHGIERRTFSNEEMAERMLFPLINEGARILEEGIALRASDIDLVWVNGYGWPRYLGGPMFYADERGLAYVVERLESFAQGRDDPSLQPAALLRTLAREGSSFSQWQAARRVVS